MSYPVDKKAQIHSELALLTPRLACFAAALTGSEAASNALIKATRNQVLARARERGNTPLVLWAFSLMHGLWSSRWKGAAQGETHSPADPRLFQPRSGPSGDAAGTGRMARFVAQLSPRQRGALHLVYGERLSYDEVADIFAMPVSAMMTLLARAHAALSQRQDGSSPAASVGAVARQVQDGMRGREYAA